VRQGSPPPSSPGPTRVSGLPEEGVPNEQHLRRLLCQFRDARTAVSIISLAFSTDLRPSGCRSGMQARHGGTAVPSGTAAPPTMRIFELRSRPTRQAPGGRAARKWNHRNRDESASNPSRLCTQLAELPLRSPTQPGSHQAPAPSTRGPFPSLLSDHQRH